jgi:ABC-type glycerol-3-phosphate transport system permease component
MRAWSIGDLTNPDRSMRQLDCRDTNNHGRGVMNLELWIIVMSLGLFAALLACLEIGYRNGMRTLSEAPESGQEGIGAIEAAVFGLLGLLLALSLSGTTSRLDARRQLIVQEANAIGTAYLRIDLLPESGQAAVRDLFREYLRARLALTQNLTDEAAIEKQLERSADLQQVIWSRVVVEAQKDPSGNAARLLLPAVNEMIDVTTARAIARHTHLPVLVFVLLVGVALLSALMAGYAMARRRKRSWLHMALYSSVIALTIYVLLDLENPRVGLIRLDAADKAMTDLLQSVR